eukprot:3390827-Pleurochrysis_carterae.AAC.1
MDVYVLLHLCSTQTAETDAGKSMPCKYLDKKLQTGSKSMSNRIGDSVAIGRSTCCHLGKTSA